MHESIKADPVIKPQPEQEPLKTLTASIFKAKANHELILDTRSELGKHAKTARGENGGGANREKVPHLSLACRWWRKNARDRRRRRRNSWQARVPDGRGRMVWSEIRGAERRRKEASSAARRRMERLVEAREKGFIGWTGKKRIRPRSPLLEDFLEVFLFFSVFFNISFSVVCAG